MLNCFSCVQLFGTLWTVAHQASLSMGFSRQEYWSGLPCPPQGDLPDPGIEPVSPALQADSLPLEPPGKPHRTHSNVYKSMLFSQFIPSSLSHMSKSLFSISVSSIPALQIGAVPFFYLILFFMYNAHHSMKQNQVNNHKVNII